MSGSDADAGYTIAYGALDDPGAVLADARSEPLAITSARIHPGQPALRLNTRGWLALHPSMASEFGTHAQRVAFCTEALQARTPLFARPIRAFLARYLAFVAASVEQRREDLEARLERAGLPVAGGILDYRDWFFSALLPLPNAWIVPGDGAARDLPPARVDCAFWTGETLVAILLGGLTMPSPRQARAIDALREGRDDIEIIHLPTATGGDGPALTPALEALFARVPDAAALPYGPFRLAGLARE